MQTKKAGSTISCLWPERSGLRRSVARKLAVIMHAMWRDGTVYADAVETGVADGGATAKERKLLGVYA